MILVLQFNSFLIYEILQVLMCVYLIKHVVSSVISCVFVDLSLIIQVPPICRFLISDFFMPQKVMRMSSAKYLMSQLTAVIKSFVYKICVQLSCLRTGVFCAVGMNICKTER